MAYQPASGRCKHMQLQQTSERHSPSLFGIAIAMHIEDDRLLSLIIVHRGRDLQGDAMWKLVAVMSLCLLTLPAFCQSGSKYQVATILEITPHQSNGQKAGSPVRYDVSVKVGDTIYVALYTPGLADDATKYAAGRDLLVRVEKDTITYSDLLGRSYEAPIQSQHPAAASKASSQ